MHLQRSSKNCKAEYNIEKMIDDAKKSSMDNKKVKNSSYKKKQSVSGFQRIRNPFLGLEFDFWTATLC